MAGVKGRSGGKRPGAGRPPGAKSRKTIEKEKAIAVSLSTPKPKRKAVAQPGAEPDVLLRVDEDTDSLQFLRQVYRNSLVDVKTRVRAAGIAAQYEHTRTKDGAGKREGQAAAAEKAAKKFSPSAPPLRVVGR